MSQHSSPSSGDDQPHGDPWHVTGYLVSGVVVYGLLGALADRWLHTRFLVGVGIVVGAFLGIYLTWARFGRMPSVPPAGPDSRTEHDTEP